MKDNFLTRLFGQKKMLDIPTQDTLGWHELNTVNVRHYMNYNNQYENGYSSIRAISKRFMSIQPYAIDGNGKTVKESNVINVLARPNIDMSMFEFRDALATMTLVHNKVYIRVHHRGNTIRENTITGFTILEGVIEIPDKDGITYQTRQGTTLSENEVIVLKDINPYDLSEGYSPANAARKWATLDDLIAAYQTGFFENGAVPAGQFLIAAQGEEFEDIVRNLKTKLRGASKNNNVLYSQTPINPVTGQAAPAQITWVPMNTNNKDMSLDEIFKQANMKIDSIYAVPASVRGVSEGSTYVNVRIDQETFIDNTVRPFTLSIWDRFTFELNRITGGLGYTIVFDLETPYIAEEAKAKAEAESIETATLLSLVQAGYTLKSSADALQLPEAFYKLKLEEKPEPVVAPVVEDKPEVDEGEEVEDAPEPEDKTKEIEAIDLNCQHCGRYLMKATGTVIVEDMPCPKCKAKNNFKVINPLGSDKTHTFKFAETEPKDWKQVANSKQISEEQKALITDKIEMVIRQQMERQIERVDIEKKALSELDADDAKLYAQEVLAIVMPLMTAEGMKQYLLSRTIEGIPSSELGTFVLSPTQMARYQKYLEGVAKGYAEDTEKNIKKVLEDGIGNNLPAQDVKKNLQAVMQTDEWRVKRLALTETNRAGNSGSVFAMEQVAKDAKVKINKVWVAQKGACEYCVALDGKTVGVSEVFVEKGDEITGADGGVMKNSFGHMDVSTAHPNCSCYTTYKVVK